MAGQFRDRANAEQRVAALRLFGHFRVFALPGRRDATYEVRSDPVSDAAAMQLAGELRRAGFTDVRLEMDRQ